MKKKIKVYLDTSVISALFDERNPERKSLTEDFFNQIEDFEPYVSEITIAEIERTLEIDLKHNNERVNFTILNIVYNG